MMRRMLRLTAGHATEFVSCCSPPRDVVVFNAAAVLVTASLAADLAAGVALAQKTIDSGAVLRLLKQLQLVGT